MTDHAHSICVDRAWQRKCHDQNQSLIPRIFTDDGSITTTVKDSEWDEVWLSRMLRTRG
jgi:hypothetical protein